MRAIMQFRNTPSYPAQMVFRRTLRDFLPAMITQEYIQGEDPGLEEGDG